MPVPKIWRRRSNAMKVVTILITITLIIHIVSMVTDKWMTNSETYGDNGLWSYTVQRKTGKYIIMFSMSVNNNKMSCYRRFSFVILFIHPLAAKVFN